MVQWTSDSTLEEIFHSTLRFYVIQGTYRLTLEVQWEILYITNFRSDPDPQSKDVFTQIIYCTNFTQ